MNQRQRNFVLSEFRDIAELARTRLRKLHSKLDVRGNSAELIAKVKKSSAADLMTRCSRFNDVYDKTVSIEFKFKKSELPLYQKRQKLAGEVKKDIDGAIESVRLTCSGHQRRAMLLDAPELALQAIEDFSDYCGILVQRHQESVDAFHAKNK